MRDDDKLLHCNFCGKTQHDVQYLIAGPGCYICEECIELCNEIIAERNTAWVEDVVVFAAEYADIEPVLQRMD